MKKLFFSLSLIFVSVVVFAQSVANDPNFSGRKMSFYENGNFNTVANYENGVPNGEYLTYYENGQLKEKGLYKNGLKHGSWSAYNENGQAISSAHLISAKTVSGSSGTTKETSVTKSPTKTVLPLGNG